MGAVTAKRLELKSSEFSVIEIFLCMLSSFNLFVSETCFPCLSFAFLFFHVVFCSLILSEFPHFFSFLVFIQ